MRSYEYVGPEEIRERVADDEPGSVIRSLADLEQWIVSSGTNEAEVICTFVIDRQGLLRVADRHSEHVACAGGEPVLSAGELTFIRRQRWEVEAATNQSTGYCPEPESWTSVATALEAAGIDHPEAWTNEFVFRKCTSCGERNIVKEDWFVCDLCDSELPSEWNFAPEL